MPRFPHKGANFYPVVLGYELAGNKSHVFFIGIRI